MEETKPFPKALQYMVSESNRQLQEMQKIYSGAIIEAGLELMQTLGISPAEWRMDLDNMRYVKTTDIVNAPISE